LVLDDTLAGGTAALRTPTTLWRFVNLAQALGTGVWTASLITLALLATAVTLRRSVAWWLTWRVWAPGQLRIAGARLEVEGLEQIDLSRPCLVAVNHQSIIDIPVIFAALPARLHFMVKKELKAVPFLGWFIAAMGMVFVERSRSAAATAGIRRAVEALRSGRSIVSFPEGTRSRSGQLEPFKLGGFAAAIEAGVPVVPAAIHGASAVLPPGGFRVRPGTIRLAVGRPIPTSQLTASDRGRLAQQVRADVSELLSGLDRRDRCGECRRLA
jgi:1-acyl-sn-glycerol-3-phosphate acyltransferase